MPDRPNVILITADHLRFDTVACNGDPVVRTPNIDRLAAEGTNLTQCYAQNPVCQPARASILTGRYPRNHGVRWNSSRLDENELTMVEHFKANGYRTAVVGKHHVNQKRFADAMDHVDAAHCRRNWREREDGNYTVTDPNQFEQYVRDRGYEYKTGYALPDFRKRLGAVPSDQPEDCHIDAYVGMRAVEYVQSVDTDRPLFLWLGFYGPHHPYVPSGRFAHMYNPDRVPGFHKSDDDLARKPYEYTMYFETDNHKYRGFPDASEQTFREMKAAFYGMVSQLDWALGLFLDCLEQRGMADNTVIVFTSDHGEFLGDHGIPAKAPFLLDCMLHVPCIYRGPGVPHAVRSDELTESVDIFPTLCGLAGIDTPAQVQGKDCAVLLSDSPAPLRDAVYAEAVDKKCVRTGKWKYIHYPGKPYGELYDVQADPHELRNLYDEMPDVRARLLEVFRSVIDRTEDFRHPRYQWITATHPRTGEEVTHYHTW